MMPHRKLQHIVVGLGLALAVFTAALPAVAQPSAPPERWALVVGVSDYRNLSPSLSGPRNDVTLVSAALADAGFKRANMRVLADGLDRSAIEPKVTADGEPTRVAILASLDWLARSAGRDSQVMIYMSGHGSQAPASAADETDGLDELFLPIDVAKVSGSGPVPNAITDNEIREKLRALLDSGANVWLVVDACHSGTLSRAQETSRTARFLDPAALGLPNVSSERGMIRLADAPPGDTPADGVFNFGQSRQFVGFYAALPSQVAYESAAPVNAAGAGRSVVGEFTWSLVTAIRAGGLADYEELGRQVVATHAQGMRSDTIPMFEGDLRQPPMLGSGAGGKSIALKADGGQLLTQSGAIDGLGAGAILELTDRTAGSKALGRTRVTSVGLNEARLEIISTTPDGTAVIAAAKAGSRPELARIGARLVAHSPSFVLRIAHPALLPGVTATAADSAMLKAVINAVDVLIKQPPERQSVALAVVGPDEPADIYPYIAKGSVWFFPRGADLALLGPGAPYSLPTPDFDVTANTLGKTFRALGMHANLMRIADAIRSSDVSNALDARLFVKPASPELRRGDRCEALDEGYAKDLPGIPQGAHEFVWRKNAPVVMNCDMVYLQIRNTGPAALDVSTFYVDLWGNVSFLWTYDGGADGYGMRLKPGQSRIVYYPESLGKADEHQAVGPMQLLVLATTSRTGDGPAEGFSRLDIQLPQYRSDDLPAGDFGAMLERAGFADGRMRNATVSTGSTGGTLIVPLITQADGVVR